ncbi:thioredoxin family protein [Thalassotalea insulae]|nr:thioredoxin family protein [Thalassotalea insulae]
MLIGKTTQTELFNQFNGFAQDYQHFLVNEVQQQQIQNWPDDITIDVFFGTWCHDSQREVPQLLKLLSYNPNISISLVALDYHKSEPLGLAEANNIQFTPTFIVYRHGREMGRIIERANSSIVKDINQMLML